MKAITVTTKKTKVASAFPRPSCLQRCPGRDIKHFTFTLQSSNNCNEMCPRLCSTVVCLSLAGFVWQILHNYMNMYVPSGVKFMTVPQVWHEHLASILWEDTGFGSEKHGHWAVRSTLRQLVGGKRNLCAAPTAG